MRKIIIILLILLSVIFKSGLAQDFGNCTPGYISVTVGDGSPGNPIQTYTNVPNICTDSSNASQSGLLPIGTNVRLNPPAYTGSNGSRPGRIFGYQFSLYPDNPTVEVRYQIRFTPDAGMYLDTAALLPGEFEVVSDSVSTGTSLLTMLYTLREFVIQ